MRANLDREAPFRMEPPATPPFRLATSSPGLCTGVSWIQAPEPRLCALVKPITMSDANRLRSLACPLKPSVQYILQLAEIWIRCPGLLTSKDRMIIITGIDVKSRGGIGTCVHKYSPWFRMTGEHSFKVQGSNRGFFAKPGQTLSERCPSSRVSANFWRFRCCTTMKFNGFQGINFVHSRGFGASHKSHPGCTSRRHLGADYMQKAQDSCDMPLKAELDR